MPDEPLILRLVEEALAGDLTPETVCADYPELLRKVLAQYERCRSVSAELDAIFPASGGDDSEIIPDGAELPQLSGYEIEAVLGRGGMGIVYKARQLSLNRSVALKMVLSGIYASRMEHLRFIREAEAVADLRHEHIVQIYDVGDTHGRPFFTMELVEGGTLSQQLAGAPQPAQDAASLVLALAKAMSFAHQKGIIHRDLKPANVLLTADGTPKISDFGLARRVESETHLTYAGARLGTPSYMAPEQARGDPESVGPAADIYSLGAILYEMLTGRPPFRAETAAETERQMLSLEPVLPARLNAKVPRDLQTICLKCLEKDAERRYPTSAELAADLNRFLRQEPIRARPLGAIETAWRWGNRNKAVATALLTTTLLLTFLVVGSIWAATHYREVAGVQSNLVKIKERERDQAIRAEKAEAKLRQEAETLGNELRHNLYLSEMNLSGQASQLPSGLGRVEELLSRWKRSSPDLRQWEWFYLNGLCNRSLSTHRAHEKGVFKVAWSPNGERFASGGADGSIGVWTLGKSQVPLRLLGHGNVVSSVSWSPDGQQLASASWDRTVRTWDAMNGKELHSFRGHEGEVLSVAWSSDGLLLASGATDNCIRIWDVASKECRCVLKGHIAGIGGLAWSPDGKRFASGSRDSTIRLWDVSAEKEIRRIDGHTNWVNQVTWSKDGDRLASASNDQTAKIWDPTNGKEVLVLRGHTRAVSSVAWSPDNSQVATCGDDQTIRVWSAVGGGEAFSLRGHSLPLTAVAWNPKGDRLASSSYDGTVKTWDAAAGPESLVPLARGASVETVAWSRHNPELLAIGCADGVVQVWDTRQRVLRRQWLAKPVRTLTWHPGGNRIAASGADGVIRIWEIASAAEPMVLDAAAGEIFCVEWSPNGAQLASAGSDRCIRIWNMTAPGEPQVWRGHKHTVYAVAWNSDGNRLASASGDRLVKIWDLATGKDALTYHGHTAEVMTVAWNPNGLALASAGYDGTVQFWNCATGHKLKVLSGHTAHVSQVAWNQDGKRLASTCRDGTVKLWDTDTGNEALTLVSHAGSVNTVAWSTDGLKLATGGEDHHVHVHDATGGHLAARATR